MKKTLIIISGVLAFLILVPTAYYQYRFESHADISAYRDYFAQAVSETGAGVDQATAPGTSVEAVFMGVTTILFTDGETNLLTDGFFTRPSAFTFLTSDIEPDPKIIADSLKRAGIDELSAVMVVHSHFDHAMDAPIVAARTGALLLGSESTANIGRGLNLAEKQIRVVKSGQPMRFGRFKVTFIENKHVKLPGWVAKRIIGQQIKSPLKPPASGFAYKEGKSYSILLEHPAGNTLIHGSAGFVPGALKGIRADSVLLGTGGTGAFSSEYFESYLKETVFAVGAKRVYPVHWDDMFQPLSKPLKAWKDFPASMKHLVAGSQNGKAFEIKILPEWKRVRLY